MHPPSVRRFVRSVLLALAVAAPLVAVAADGAVEGTVTDASAVPLAGVTVRVQGTQRAAISDGEGRFRLAAVPAGERVIVAELLGRGAVRRAVTVPAGGAVEVDLSLDVDPLRLPGIVVTARSATVPGAELNVLPAHVVERTPARDVGELLRQAPGVDAVRRGPLGLDPVVRGLRETELGVYVDGTRLFPGGPGRMDSALSHIDPVHVREVEVVKGPYALTWGAGNLSAVRVSSFDLFAPGPSGPTVMVQGGLASNVGARYGSAAVSDASAVVPWWLEGAWRQGDDYEDGAGEEVPGEYRSWDLRGKLGFRTGADSRLELALGYQEQDDLDYPGRLLDAEFFTTSSLALSWSRTPRSGRLRALEAIAYYNDVDHGMDNDDKPTALPDPTRMPPFPLRVEVDTTAESAGGRFAATLRAGRGWNVELGGDLLSVRRDALRLISNRDTGMLMFADVMWPDATIDDLGTFVRADGAVGGGVRLDATLRLDLVRADADEPTAFFADNAGTEMESEETNLSAALSLARAFGDHWETTFGVGSAVRTADASERYSDRIPSTKAQTSAEFLGDPDLDPERNNQVDLWVDGRFDRVALHFNAFARRLDDAVTAELTELPTRLPLSPAVYRYVNGDIRAWGLESSLTVAATPALQLGAVVSWLRARDVTADEPGFGIPPLELDLSLRYEPPGGRWFVEAISRSFDRQDRVAETRNEGPTPGYTTGDVRFGVRPLASLELRLAVTNVTDADYAHHLNARNPFTGVPVHEPGRAVELSASYRF